MNYDEQLQTLIKNALAEDIGDGDHSTLSCIPATEKGKKSFHARCLTPKVAKNVPILLHFILYTDFFSAPFKKPLKKVSFGKWKQKKLYS